MYLTRKLHSRCTTRLDGVSEIICGKTNDAALSAQQGNRIMRNGFFYSFCCNNCTCFHFSCTHTSYNCVCYHYAVTSQSLLLEGIWGFGRGLDYSGTYSFCVGGKPNTTNSPTKNAFILQLETTYDLLPRRD